MKYLYNTQTKLFLRKCSRVAHTTNVVCLVINVITDLMNPALTLFTLYPLKCVLVFTRWVFLETKCTHLYFHVLQFLCSGIWQIRKEALLLLIQFIRWKQLCFQVLMVRSNDRQSLSHWYCRSNVLQCCIYGVFCWGTLNQFTQFSNLIKCICFEVSQQFAFLELFVLLNNIRQLLAFLLYVTVTGGLQLCTRKF